MTLVASCNNLKRGLHDSQGGLPKEGPSVQASDHHTVAHWRTRLSGEQGGVRRITDKTGAPRAHGPCRTTSPVSRDIGLHYLVHLGFACVSCKVITIRVFGFSAPLGSLPQVHQGSTPLGLRLVPGSTSVHPVNLLGVISADTQSL